MSAIDKLWGTHEQYRELSAWLTDNAPGMLGFMGRPSDTADTGLRGASIALFPMEADAWLLDNCPLEWATDQIREMYGAEVSDE